MEAIYLGVIVERSQDTNGRYLVFDGKFHSVFLPQKDMKEKKIGDKLEINEGNGELDNRPFNADWLKLFYEQKNTLKSRVVEEMGKKIKNINGYTAEPKDNVFDFITPDLYESDLKQGSGNELYSKFRAIYSSSALCVNSFAMVKKFYSEVKLFGFENFTSANFEKKLPTGLKGTPPNLDFFLENDSVFIGIESKFLETLKKSTVNFSSEDYFNDKNIFPEIKELMEKYDGQKGYLDVAQLLRHSMGLKNNCGSKKPILIFVYWRPNNWKDFDEYKEIDEELKDFATKIKGIVDFSYYSYDEMWNEISKNENLKCFIDKARNRYDLKL